jgi:hypothetical protein
MLDLGFILVLTFLAARVGLRLLDRIGGRPAHAGDALALAVTLGLGVLALATLALGELGLLNRGSLAILLAASIPLPLGEGARRAGEGLKPSRPSATPLPLGEGARRAGEGQRATRRYGLQGAGSHADIPFALALTVTILGTLLTALAPVTDGDALCYHLQVPKVFLERGALGFEPDLHETVYPLVTELLYASALAFRGPVACRLISWVLGLVFAANVTALARPFLGARAWWAGTTALLVPAVSNGMSAPLNDVALASFGTAAIVGWSRFHDAPTFPRAALAGLLTGLALGVKYPALVLAGLLVPAMMASALWNERQRRARAAGLTLVFAAVALTVGSPWYWRAFHHTGNPVYPFFRQYFGGAGLDEVLDPIKRPLAPCPMNLLSALVPLTLEPDRFDSFAHQLGPAFLLFLPGLLFERPRRRVLVIVALGYAFLTLCLTQRQSMRFVLIAVGPLAVGVAWLARQWCARTSLPGRILLAILVIVLGFESSLALVRARHGLPVLLGREDAAAYLERREPTYRVGRWMAANLPAGARVIGQDHRGYYFPRPYTMELAHRRRTGLGRRGESAGMVIDHLQRAGFTHLLLCPPVPETAVEFDPTLGRRLQPWLAERVPLYREQIRDADGVTRRYTIYELAGDPADRMVRR